jgi:hypothetical protein
MREGDGPARRYSGVRLRDARNPIRPSRPPLSVVAADVARFFQDLRGALRLSPAQAAQALATRIDIITALESAQIGALPPWPETCRIVRNYASFAGLDPRPVLHSLEQLFLSAPRAPRRAGRRLLPRFGRAKGSSGGGRAGEPRRSLRQTVNDHAGRPGMALFTVTLAVALIVLVTQTSVLEAAVSQLPPSVKRLVRGAQNYVIVSFAPIRDGLRWIDVSDPRTRRSDKLQTAAQSD